MIFYLGTHVPAFLTKTDTPLFLSRRTLRLDRRRNPPVPLGRWCMDSGGYTELSQFGEWSITTEQYIEEVMRAMTEMGGLDWVAPMDYMCEPSVREKTGLSTHAHQVLTLQNFRELREALGPIVVPVLQGWEGDDYLRHVEMYDDAGYDLTKEAVVGVGSVCRRNSTEEIVRICTELSDADVRIHAFGVKGASLRLLSPLLVSSDSLAWSYAARYKPPLEGCVGHKNCANCLRYALMWKDDLVDSLPKEELHDCYG